MPIVLADIELLILTSCGCIKSAARLGVDERVSPARHCQEGRRDLARPRFNLAIHAHELAANTAADIDHRVPHIALEERLHRSILILLDGHERPRRQHDARDRPSSLEDLPVDPGHVRRRLSGRRRQTHAVEDVGVFEAGEEADAAAHRVPDDEDGRLLAGRRLGRRLVGPGPRVAAAAGAQVARVAEDVGDEDAEAREPGAQAAAGAVAVVVVGVDVEACADELANEARRAGRGEGVEARGGRREEVVARVGAEAVREEDAGARPERGDGPGEGR